MQGGLNKAETIRLHNSATEIEEVGTFLVHYNEANKDSGCRLRLFISINHHRIAPTAKSVVGYSAFSLTVSTQSKPVYQL